jgi:putative heme-binding domain-containing protein
MFLGNVVTNRINADKIEWKGATPVGKELPDFLTSKDPWFRPTDIKLGPDGALYVADFYNKIIGHYEVDLKHPQRDKDRGRVWRIVYRGADGKGEVAKMMPDLTKLKVEEVYGYLGDSNLTVRLLATNELIQRGGGATRDPKPIPQELTERPGYSHLYFHVHHSWVSMRNRHHPDEDWSESIRPSKPTGMLYGAESRTVIRPHEMYVAASKGSLTSKERIAILEEMANRPEENRAMANVLIGDPKADGIAVLVKVIRDIPPEDTHLRHAAKVALRNCLKSEGAWKEVENLPDTALPIIAEIAVGVPTPESAAFLLKQLLSGKHSLSTVEAIGKFGNDMQAAIVVDYLGKTKSTAFAAPALSRLARGMQTRGGKLSADDLKTAETVCSNGLDAPDPGAVTAACDLAGGLKLAGLFEPLSKLAGKADRPEPQRIAAIGALAALDPVKSLPILAGFVADPAAPYPIREKAIQSLAGRDDGRAALVAALPTVPARVAAAIAVSLSGSPQGAVALLDAVKAGKASPRLLQDKAVSTKLLAIENGKFRGRVDELTKGLPNADQRLAELIKKRGDLHRGFKPDLEAGKKAFTTHCAACHQLAGQGAKVGPQLDGIGNRGADRLLEDVLDPNRNVDAAFRATQLQLADGRSLTGLLLREEGKTLVLADPAGKELRIAADDVEKRTLSALSPMPANFDTAVPEAEFFHLLAFLLEQRVKDPPK